MSGVHVFGWGFESLGGVTSDGRNVWVLSVGGDALIELNATTGAYERTISQSLIRPVAAYDDGTHLWVAESGTYAVSEFTASTGAFVRLISSRTYRIYQPQGITSDGAHVWVTNQDQSVTEIDAKTGAFVKWISHSGYFNYPAQVVSDGTYVWVTNSGNGYISILDAKTGTLVKLISGHFGTITYDHAHVWATSGSSVKLPTPARRSTSLISRTRWAGLTVPSSFGAPATP